MTDDRRVRMYVDGEQESLSAKADCYVILQDATVAEEREARDKCHAYDQAVEKLLEAKGFVMTDHAHASASLNRYLQTQSDEEDGHALHHAVLVGTPLSVDAVQAGHRCASMVLRYVSATDRANQS